MSNLLKEAYNEIGWEMEEDENWLFNTENSRID
jgi:hypothetical protein